MENNIRTVMYDGTQIDYALQRKKVKNVNLRVNSDGKVFVSANNRISLKEIDNIVLKKATFILNAKRKFAEKSIQEMEKLRFISGEKLLVFGSLYTLDVQKGEKQNAVIENGKVMLTVKDIENYDEKKAVFNQLRKSKCTEYFTKTASVFFGKMKISGKEMPLIRLRSMTSRWGSCIPSKNVITLNLYLFGAPYSCVEYVVLHELCHLVHPNHSKQFYSLVEFYMPDWRERKDLLNNYSVKIMQK